MRDFDCLFLDLDGPVLEGKHRHYGCYKDIVDGYGGLPLNQELYWELKRQKISRRVILEKSCSRGSYEQFAEEWLCNIEKEKYLDLDVVKPQAVNTIVSWKTSFEKIVLVTMRQDRDALVNQLKKLEIYALFDEVVDCQPVNVNGKFEALKHKKFRRAIFIGDTEVDTEAAKLLGITSIGITNGLRRSNLLDADYKYAELADINLSDIKE